MIISYAAIAATSTDCDATKGARSAGEGGMHEGGRDNLSVPRQIKYCGKRRVIPSSLADLSCVALGLDGMLTKLNMIM